MGFRDHVYWANVTVVGSKSGKAISELGLGAVELRKSHDTGSGI